MWTCTEIKKTPIVKAIEKNLDVILSLGTAISFWKLYQLHESAACCKHAGSIFPEREKPFCSEVQENILFH